MVVDYMVFRDNNRYGTDFDFLLILLSLILTYNSCHQHRLEAGPDQQHLHGLNTVILDQEVVGGEEDPAEDGQEGSEQPGLGVRRLRPGILLRVVTRIGAVKQSRAQTTFTT